MNSRYLVKTLGCKANLYDSQILEGQLLGGGYLPADDRNEPDLCIVNSCAVTDEADKQSKRLAEKLAREHPGARIVVTGCGTEVDPAYYENGKGIDAVVSNREKPRLLELLNSVPRKLPGAVATKLGDTATLAEFRSIHPIDREWPLPQGLLARASELDPERGARRSRAFLKIQEGCDSFCTYCVIPYGRGPARSLAPGEVVARVQTLTGEGLREVVLTGTNLGDYGVEWGAAPDGITPLLEKILSETSIERIRLGSLDPVELTPSLLRLMETESRICPHVHVSLQSPLSSVLRRMKRKYDGAKAEAALVSLSKLRSAGGAEVFVGMDLITGFPGETKEDFEETYRLLERLPWTRLHVFPFSERKGTPATKLKGVVPIAERKERAERLRGLSLARFREKAEARAARGLGGILLESPVRGPDGSRDWIAGHTPDYWRVLLPLREKGRAAGLRNTTVAAASPEVVIDSAAGDVAFSAAWLPS